MCVFAWLYAEMQGIVIECRSAVHVPVSLCILPACVYVCTCTCTPYHLLGRVKTASIISWGKWRGRRTRLWTRQWCREGILSLPKRQVCQQLHWWFWSSRWTQYHGRTNQVQYNHNAIVVDVVASFSTPFDRLDETSFDTPANFESVSHRVSEFQGLCTYW